MTGTRRGFRSLTRNQQSLFVAQLVESIGNFGLVSAFTLWATATGGTPAQVARLVSWVILANTVPRILLAPVVAWVCTRLVEYRVLQAANLTRALVCGGGLLVVGSGHAQVVGVLALTALSGALDQFFPPARAAAAQRNLHEHQRVSFGALNFLAVSGIGLLSAAITPAIYARAGLRAWLAIGLGCSVLSAAILQRGYRPAHDLTARETPRDGLRPSLWAGLRYAFTGNGAVALVTLSTVGYGLALGLTNQSMAPLALRGLHVPMTRYGWITAAFAVGGLVAYLVTERASARYGTTAALLGGAGLLSAGYLGYGLSPSLPVCTGAMLVAGVGFGVWSGVQGAILQGSVPNTMMATYLAGTAPLVPLASLTGSQLGRWLVLAAGRLDHPATMGYRASYLVAAAAVLLGALLRLAGRRARR